jgi:hypothetical protein
MKEGTTIGDSHGIQPTSCLRSRATLVPSVVIFLLFFCSAACADGGTVVGRTLDPQGATVAGAKVKLLNAAGTKIAETLSEANGNFRFAGIDPGVYQITAESPAYVSVVAGVSVASVFSNRRMSLKEA